jgi:selenide,water dikinase
LKLTATSMSEIRLTRYTKGGGCGCKIPPESLNEILKDHLTSDEFGLIEGNSHGDDAAVIDLGNNQCLISSTDFFTPIVDDPFDFGRIAAANSISDIYAMGGKPVLALSILAWPTDKLGNYVAAEVIKGARHVCKEAGIAIGGGHSIENPEPIFGLSVNGVIDFQRLKRNHTAHVGDVLLLTKPIGTGILSTALKRGLLVDQLKAPLIESMCQLNAIGEKLSAYSTVHAMTDVTGFGLLGHLIEMAEGSELSVRLEYHKVPLLEGAKSFATQMIYPDNTMRNWKNMSHKVKGIGSESLLTLCDPQTNGGLLLALDPKGLEEITAAFQALNHHFWFIGSFEKKGESVVLIND